MPTREGVDVVGFIDPVAAMSTALRFSPFDRVHDRRCFQDDTAGHLVVLRDGGGVVTVVVQRPEPPVFGRSPW